MGRLAKAGVTGALVMAGILPLVLYFLVAQRLAFVSGDGWIGAGRKLCPVEVFLPGTAIDVAAPSARESSVFHQALAIAGGFWIKPLYTLLALLIALRIWRRAEPDLRALKWAMLFFFTGENFCAANYLFTRSHDSFLLEYLHGLGMILCFAFTAYALFEGMDRRLVHLSHPEEKCAALTLCRGCAKHQAVPCGLERVFIMIGLAAALLACIPLSGRLRVVSYNTTIFGVGFNYSHPLVYQFAEMRYFPVIAAALFLAGVVALSLGNEDRVRTAKFLFAAAVGPFGFSLLRFGLFSSFFDDLAWMDFWEETTELVFVAGVAIVLFIFRKSLLGRAPAVSGTVPGT